MSYDRKTIRAEARLFADITEIAKEQNQSVNQTIETALKLYRDYYYLQNKACIINEQIVGIVQGSLKICENTINTKTNRVLSEVAIQSAIQNLLLAESLEISQQKLASFRLQAIEFLRQQNRVLRLDETIDE